MKGFIATELERITAQMQQCPPGSAAYKEHYVAQQTLSWALQPDQYRAPSNVLSGQKVEQDAPSAFSGRSVTLEGQNPQLGDRVEGTGQIVEARQLENAGATGMGGGTAGQQTGPQQGQGTGYTDAATGQFNRRLA